MWSSHTQEQRTSRGAGGSRSNWCSNRVAGAVRGQYSTQRMPLSHYRSAEHVVQIDNERVRVTRWSFPVESSTGHHRHDYDYIVVPLSTGHLLVRSQAGQSSGELVTGEAYFRQSGVEHEVINDNDFEIAFIEI